MRDGRPGRAPCIGRTRGVTLVAAAVLVAACAGPVPAPNPDPPPPSTAATTVPRLPFPPAPAVPDGPLADDVVSALDSIWRGIVTGIDPADVAVVGASGDARLAWLLADLLRFFPGGEVQDAIVDALEQLTGVRFEAPVVWVAVTDHLIAWDLPAPPGYVDYKRILFTQIEPKWEPFFTEPSGLDHRWVTWGGVFIDDRPLGTPFTCPNACIPALDDPAVTDAEGGDWYPDDGVVFGVVIDGEARAYPRNIMEVHEMVNDRLGGRRFALPYCTLCGSAQAFFTDDIPGFDLAVMRTTGLLSRSNKVMFDVVTFSAFDTFRGVAATGPMFEAGVTLRPISVVTTTWGAWKEAHPDTTIVAEDGGIGRVYPDDPLGGRDANGPIFPIGDRDLRLPVQAQVVGVVLDDGTPVAFPADAARVALLRGDPVELAGVRLVLDGDGLRAVGADGTSIASHQAFWFAWSQFNPDTLLWVPPLGD